MATRKDAQLNEKEARLEIIKVMSYHKLYLNDEDLRMGYDSVMKTVEQGVEPWLDRLAGNLEKFYEFRANVVLRDKVINGDKKLAGGNKDTKEGEEVVGTSGEEVEGKVIYCMDFNKGSCTHEKSHVGKWKGKKLTKWHVCRSCLKNSELLAHPEKDCPNKQA